MKAAIAKTASAAPPIAESNIKIAVVRVMPVASPVVSSAAPKRRQGFDERTPDGQVGSRICSRASLWSETSARVIALCRSDWMPHGSAKSFSEALEERGLAKKRDGSGRQGFSGVTFRQSPKQV
jgi:hypothetical protein